MDDKTTKDKIIEAMYHLVAEKGYDKTSIGQIADSIGIKKASVYYYFKSKEDIFFQMVKIIYEKDYYYSNKLLVEEIREDAYQQELITIGEEFIDSYFENKDLRKIYAEIDVQTARIPELKKIAKDADEELIKFLVRCMKQGVEIGVLPQNCDVDLNAQILYTMLTGIDQAILYDLPIDAKAVWKETIMRLFERRVCN
ncbi:MAG: TetR/AcrR family transcriptional regulator [Anaerovoracaceae bacterium]